MIGRTFSMYICKTRDFISPPPKKNNVRSNSMPLPKKPIQTRRLTNQQKADIGKYAAANPHKTETEIADWSKQFFNLQNAPHRTSIGRIIKRKEEFENLPI